MNNELYKNFLTDFISELINKENGFEKNSDLYKGYNFAMYEVISLLLEQSSAFGIDENEVGLDKISHGLEQRYLGS